jgi:biopolymer transport protein ExbB
MPSARAWWNDEWAFRKELSFDLSPAGAAIGENVTDVPVLLRLTLTNFPYFNDAKPDGSDLRVIAADDKTPLKFHVEKFDAQNQIALIWIRVPQLTGGAARTDKIYLYYGNGKSTAAADVAGTYDGQQSLVYHFMAPAGPQDSTGYRNEPQGLAADALVPSLIGTGLSLDGNKAFTVPAAPSLALAPEQGYIISAWVKPSAAQQSTIAALREGGRELVLGFDAQGFLARWRDAGRDTIVRQAAPASAGDWHHVALRAAGGKLLLLVDGAEAGQADVSLQVIAGGLTVATGFVGEIDELQVANTARSVGWLRASALSQGLVAPLVSYGADAQKDSGGSESYFASTLRNVTVDGWVIIGVLAVLFVASVLIMIGKVLFLNRVGGANRRFITDFHRLRDDPAALAREKNDTSYGSSMLWILYQDGIGETMKRFEGQAAGADRARTLSAQSIEAIRATIDATQTRQTQRLQSQMVWLTIAISGGPFLGLLGTVVGVMITFAAIAASGDVNINAIAPGTAAALVATVAGLGVAIPCLFGYNYLNSRIKEQVADMRVFVDEFVTRVAETYS